MCFAAGGLLTGVPGEVAGLRALHERFGRLPWRDLVVPVGNMAIEGFRVSHLMARAMDRAQNEFGLDQLVNNLLQMHLNNYSKM